MVYPAVDDVHFWSNLESTRWLDHIKVCCQILSRIWIWGKLSAFYIDVAYITVRMSCLRIGRKGRSNVCLSGKLPTLTPTPLIQS